VGSSDGDERFQTERALRKSEQLGIGQAVSGITAAETQLTLLVVQAEHSCLP
jgi:hypothetical protein